MPRGHIGKRRCNKDVSPQRNTARAKARSPTHSADRKWTPDISGHGHGHRHGHGHGMESDQFHRAACRREVVRLIKVDPCPCPCLCPCPIDFRTSACGTVRASMDAPRQAPLSRLSVVFIGGLGRSGSTLLDRLLGQQPGCVAVGEIGLIWRSGLAEDRLCGCGTPLRSCAVWESVARRGVRRVRRAPAATVRCLARFLGSPPALRRAPPPDLVRSARRRVQRWPSTVTISRVCSALLQAVTGCRVVVDSSKTPAHLAALLTLPGIDVHVVHLVRDSRAVAYSWRQRRRRVRCAATRGVHRGGTGLADRRFVDRHQPGPVAGATRSP